MNCFTVILKILSDRLPSDNLLENRLEITGFIYRAHLKKIIYGIKENKKLFFLNLQPVFCKQELNKRLNNKKLIIWQLLEKSDNITDF